MSNIKERVLLIAENQSYSKEIFFKKIDISYANFKGKAKETPLNSDTIANIMTHFPDIDPMWLLTGTGSMQRKLDSGGAKIEELSTSKTSRRMEEQAIPLYSYPATAGIIALINNAQNFTPVDYMYIPNMPKCDGALPIRGDSMYPLLKSGDMALYKVIMNRENIIWGEMYLIAMILDGEEYLLAKYLQKGSKAGWVKLVSQNQNHQDMEYPAENIKALALIKAVIRINTAV